MKATLRMRIVSICILAMCLPFLFPIPGLAAQAAKLSGVSVPKTVLQGQSFSIKGTATGALSRLYVAVLDSRGKTEQSASIAATGKKTNVAAAAKKLNLKALSPGKKTLMVSIYCGKQKAAVSKKSFTVQAIRHTHYYQGDRRWGFPRAVRSRACLMTSYAMVLKNMGEGATPKTLYQKLRDGFSSPALLKKTYGVSHACALPKKSKYLARFSKGKTYIKNPKKNAKKAAAEALKLHPEGVILYFQNGKKTHGVVAVKNAKGKILFNDPGRTAAKGEKVEFSGTWLAVEKYQWKHLAYMVALD